MWDAAGLSRNGADLREALARLRLWKVPSVTDAKSAEDVNLLLAARAVVASALAREESRGGHYRTDFPESDPAQAKHSSIRQAHA
jgi:L-aspartate oxidase